MMYDQTRPGVSEELYNSFEDVEKAVFNLIVSNPGGVGKDETMEKTGVTYAELKNTVSNLQRKRVPINVNTVAGMYWSFQYCSFAEDYDKWIKN